MKTWLLILVLSAFSISTARASCGDFKSRVQLAKNAVMAVMAVNHLEKAVSFEVGVEKEEGDLTFVSVQPHYQFKKDWYKVSLRRSDCRVINLNLFLENIPLQ